MRRCGVDPAEVESTHESEDEEYDDTTDLYHNTDGDHGRGMGPDGRETTDQWEIHSCTVSFYEDLYQAEQCNETVAAKLLHDLPQLSEMEVHGLDLSLSFEELMVAGQPGRAPGLDELTAAFYGL
ncbi:hypothetical protein AAFF_G00116480 [Aldrovandia affinis]|uniref:Uncharacterized protein n=1 Tax=Aldrovandia affinis TaxID=143900 RepID=A0AAD7T1I2_9TELE|nr:hypothetical protein AAFF_G00116480 [Aldrovandia affinis]